MTQKKSAVRIHWSFWIIGILALIWNAMGAMNYLMQANPQALANYPDAARALVESRPAWATGAFAVSVFGGLLGGLLLLFRRSVATYLFVVSFFGAIVTNIHTFRVGASVEIWIGSLLAIVVAAFLVWYARIAARKHWTR